MHFQRVGRHFEVIVAQHPLAAGKFLAGLPGSEQILHVAHPNVRVEAEVRLLRAILVTIGRIGQNQDVVMVVVMLEIIGDPFGLHQAAEKSKIGLAVLNAVVPLSVLLAQVAAEIRCESQLLHDLLDDVRNGLILKDPAIGLQIEEREPGNHLGT